MQESLSATHDQNARFRLLVESVQDCAIFLIGRTGQVETWNGGAQRITGYSASEITGKHHSIFYPPTEQRRGKPAHVLQVATDEGRFEEEHWRVRKDGSRFWASVVITALQGPAREPIGFAKVIRDLTERKQAEDDRYALLSLERGVRARTESFRCPGQVENPRRDFAASTAHRTGPLPRTSALTTSEGTPPFAKLAPMRINKRRHRCTSGSAPRSTPRSMRMASAPKRSGSSPTA